MQISTITLIEQLILTTRICLLHRSLLSDRSHGGSTAKLAVQQSWQYNKAGSTAK
jgi:hypothetical protein